MIAGLEIADGGDVYISGKEATAIALQKRGVGFVFQHYAPFKHMTVWDNVAFGLQIRRRPKAEIRKRVDELLELVQLGGLGRRYPAQLSGGQRQRMALARALAVEPSVLLLDEPFGALDARVREELRSWLRRLHDELHATTVFVTHDQREAMEVSDQVVVLNEGRVEQAGPPTEVYERPASAFVAGFVGTSNIIDGVSVRPEKISIGGDGPRGVEGTVDELVYTGATTRCVVALDDGTTLSVLLLNGAGATAVPARGERVRLTWHPEHEIQLKEAP